MSHLSKNLLDLINKGREGRNKGLSTGLPKLDNLISGVQRGWLTVIAGGSGSGKTSLAIYSYVYQPLKQMLGDPKLKIVYFSLEISKELLMAKLLSIYILDTYHESISFKELLSFNDKLDDYRYKIVIDAFAWLSEVEKHLIIYDKPVNADGVNEFLTKYLATQGQFKEINENQIEYISNYEDPYHIVVIDHIRLLSGQPKEQIDKLCDYLVYLRNVAKITPVLIQQINRDSQSMDRRKGGYNLIQQSDLADSSSPAQSAEVILALFHPFREQLTTCCGYDISQLNDKCRINQCIKNRYGESDKAIGTSFFGSVGVFKELPRPDEISDYSLYQDVGYYLNENKQIVKEEIYKKEIKPSFDLSSFGGLKL